MAQFHQPHNFMPGLRVVLEADLPDVQQALRDAGASRLDFVNPLPAFFSDREPRPIDERLWTYTTRRPAGEWAFANAAAHEPRVNVRRGVQATAFMAGASTGGGIPHVASVKTAGGEEIRADVVVDAMGRRSRSPEWLTAIGARQAYEEQADCGFTYYTRYFRGSEPERVGPIFMPSGTISLLTLPGDHGTWSVTIFTATGDQPLKQLRHADKWTKVVRAFPLQAHWLDGEPITDVLAMSGVVDRYRRFVVDGTPVATGLLAVADAWGSTNPSAGRGMTVGMLHAARLRDVMRDRTDDPRALVEAFDRVTERDITPWYRAQLAADRVRFAQIDALREGRQPPPPADELGALIASFFVAMPFDLDLFRAGLEYVATITPIQQIAARSEIAEKLRAAMAIVEKSGPLQLPGPDRAALLELLA